MNDDDRDYAGEVIEILNDIHRGLCWHAWCKRREAEKALLQMGREKWNVGDVEQMARDLMPLLLQNPETAARWEKARRK